jgi:peptidoglycan/xylan/chitin deacetylase (PgdA/CDA1 family)/predicted NAD-dependent protein-ADP-ribosyltransferase YbiA (DUF1768 family)
LLGDEPTFPAHIHLDPHGAVIRGDAGAKRLALVFTGDRFGEGAPAILDALQARKLKAAFFLTGNFLRDPRLRPHVERMVAEGHYVGPHSDRHLLYADWTDRDKSLVTQEEFAADLTKNIADLRALGALPLTPAAGDQHPASSIEHPPVYFIPPYEHFNRDQVDWARQLGVVMANFTPGTGSNRDYAREGDQRFVPAQKIYDDILAFDQANPAGLNGFLLLMHVGSGRQDPFHPHVGQLCDELARRGYQLVRIDELLSIPAPGAAESAAAAPRYPAHWWAPVPPSARPSAWEILPQAAGPGEVILSKRHELGLLSNFAPTPFTFRGRRYASVEGFWQAMKYPEGPDDPRAAAAEGVAWPHTRDEVAQMVAFEAKAAGDAASRNMRRLGVDWVSFEGRRFPYRPAQPGEHYQLIVAAMRAKLEQNPEVRRLLLSTGDLVLKPDHRQEPHAPAAWRYHEIWMQLRTESGPDH